MKIYARKIKKVGFTKEELIEIKDSIYDAREYGNQNDTQIDILNKIRKELDEQC